jgi:hypothetical protein
MTRPTGKPGAIRNLETGGTKSRNVTGCTLPIEARVLTAMETVSDDATQDLSSLGTPKSPKPRRPS